MALENKKPKGPDAGHTSESEEIWDARPRRLLRRSRGRSRRPRSRSPGDLPPPLRKTLVTSLRTMSEAIYQDIVQVQMQQVHSPLTWEELAWLAQLRGPLYTLVQIMPWPPRRPMPSLLRAGWCQPHHQVPRVQLRMEEKPRAPPRRETGPPLPPAGDS